MLTETFKLEAYDKDNDVYETIAENTDAEALISTAYYLRKNLELSRKNGEPVDWLQISDENGNPMIVFTGEPKKEISKDDLTEYGKRNYIFRNNVFLHQKCISYEYGGGLLAADVDPIGDGETAEISITFLPKGANEEIDLAYVKAGNEKTDYKNGILIRNFNDIFTEDYTKETVITRDDIVKAFDIEA